MVKRESLASEVEQLRGDVGAIFDEDGQQVALLYGWSLMVQSLLGVTGVRIQARGLWLSAPLRGNLRATLYKNDIEYTVEKVKLAMKSEEVPEELAPWPQVFLGKWSFVGTNLNIVRR